MSLDNFYKLRKNFIILGLTGKMQAGADKIVELLSQDGLSDEQTQFLDDFENVYATISDSETRKIRRVKDFFNYEENWIKFDVIDYRNVILLFILHHNYNADNEKYAAKIANWITSLGDYKEFKTPRFGGKVGIAENSAYFLQNEFKDHLIQILPSLDIPFNQEGLLDFLKKDENDIFFSKGFKEFAKSFFDKLDSYSRFLRHKLNHVAAYCLRRFGTLDIGTIKEDKKAGDLEHIYIIADVINTLIKIHRRSTEVEVGSKTAHIIIDRLKNSYEMMYFREKYSGFYMVAANREEASRNKCLEDKNSAESSTDVTENLKLLKALDEIEYKVSEFKKGDFDGFDVENCVQKSDYHIVLKENKDLPAILSEYQKATQDIKDNSLSRTNEYYVYQPFITQVLKLVSLIQQPGLITPTYVERMMQVAYNAKLNSGCISRQVGAVVTDANFSVKGIGWNEVPYGQIPCGSRDIRDLVRKGGEEFTKFELGESDHTYKDEESFIEKIGKDFGEVENLDDNLKGRPCSFCFKSHHNAYEAKENQVHTRSLHAEENAMLQISKFGGQPLKGGNLFTTASPCELCSKKAFQLGVKNIFYIDLYPGISRKHILEGGRKEKHNPAVYQFQGVIGRSYQKLYEPFMSVKDETILRSGIRPKESKLPLDEVIDSWDVDKDTKDKIKMLLGEN